ncbi:hypothetical protein AMECASPLE_029623 [Ameca splendens]|uniref:Secreted protein n=1 Tax=Ameca splendens TaxID=208324 RepID=A0ABV1A1K8_9TELE
MMLPLLQPTIPSLSTRTYTSRVTGGWCASHAACWGKRRGTTWKVPCMQKLTFKGNSERPINRTYIFLDFRGKPEYLEKTHPCTKRTCKHHVERPEDLFAVRQ